MSLEEMILRPEPETQRAWRALKSRKILRKSDCTRARQVGVASPVITMHKALDLAMPCAVFVLETDSHHVK